MLNLNDLCSFVKIVEHGGFSAAAREMCVQKSTLSRRIAALETTLGASLIRRSSRQFQITAFGQEFYQRCLSLTEEARRVAEFAKENSPFFAEQAATNETAIKTGAATSPANNVRATEALPRRQDIVQLHILQSIRRKEFEPGDKLPSERNLAAQLGVARQAVREAVRSLEMSGVLRLERGAHGGAFIRKIGPDGIAYSIRNMLILGDLPLNDLLELRASAFGQAARLVAERGRKADLLLLQKNIEKLELVHRTSPQIATIELSTAFYRIAGRASRNRLLSVLVDAIADIIEEMLAHMKNWPFVQEGEMARRDALQAILVGDGQKAESIIRSHCEETNLVLLEFGRTTYDI